MKTIFNSLGSNYDWGYVQMALNGVFNIDKDKSQQIKLKGKLSAEFNGEVELTYKGRDAIELCLRKIGIGEGDEVMIQAFTCHAIEEAIVRAGAKPVFVDLGTAEINPNVDTLNNASKNAKNLKVLIIQNTLGYPADVKLIKNWCKQRGIYLIEDLAQSYGARDKNGNKLGKYGDAIIMSFGRDKILDAVSGGAVIFKRKAKSEKKKVEMESVSRSVVIKDMLYPFFTWVIRRTHHIVVGKVVQRVLVLMKLIRNPIESPTKKITSLPSCYAKLVLRSLEELNEQLEHRLKIVRVYELGLKNAECRMQNISIKAASNLRYPIVVDDPGDLLKYLKTNHIELFDRWYRKPVDFGNLNKQTSYVEGSCPNAEKLAKHIVNLPTHREISVMDAKRICELVNQFSE